MTILLDTSVFLFAILGDYRLSRGAASHFRDPGNRLFLSMASLWEMAIKTSLGKLQMPTPIDRFISEELAYNRTKSSISKGTTSFWSQSCHFITEIPSIE